MESLLTSRGDTVVHESGEKSREKQDRGGKNNANGVHDAAPLGPMSATSAPAPIVKETPSSGWSPPKRRVTLST